MNRKNRSNAIITAIASGQLSKIETTHDQLFGEEASSENIILALHFLKDNGRPKGWEKREFLYFFPDPTPITDESIKIAVEGLQEYEEHKDYIRLLRNRFEIIMEGLECYLTLKGNDELHLLHPYEQLLSNTPLP